MKIKAIYKYTYGHDEEEVLIIGIAVGEFACIDKFGSLFFASKRELSVIDERYLQELKEVKEYEQHKGFSKEEVDDISETAIRNSRKKTAEKFAERLKEKLEENSPIAGYDLEDLEFDGEMIQECIDEICKEFTENEKEN